MATRLALIGRGRWGGAIERTLRAIPEITLTVHGRDDLPSRDVNGVLIATPSASHAELALPYIEAGIATFIEKPMTTSVAEAERLRAAADRSGAVVFVGHIHLYNPAFQALLQTVSALGAIRYVLCIGMNDNPRSDSSILWDWLPHDLAMAYAVFGSAPLAVSAWRLGGNPVHTAGAEIRFAQSHLLSVMSWNSTVRRQQMTVVGEKGMLVFDDKAEHKLAHYDADGAVSYPQYAGGLPLTEELQAFLAMMRSGMLDRSHIALGTMVARTIAAADRSMVHGGVLVDIVA